MDKYIRVKNCNCISDATIEIVEKSLNIKYGSNGTGKSTISEAIYAQANNETDRLKDFKPYGSNDNSQPTVDNPYFHVVKVFNEDYVNSYLFQGDEFLDDSFQVFLKSDKCDSLAAQIERMLEELQDLINNIDAIHNLRTFLPQYTAAVKASDGTVSRRGGVAEFVNGNGGGFNHYSELKAYKPFYSRDLPSVAKWAKWRNDGIKQMCGNDCPFCTNILPSSIMLSSLSEFDGEQCVYYLDVVKDHSSALYLMLNRIIEDYPIKGGYGMYDGELEFFEDQVNDFEANLSTMDIHIDKSVTDRIRKSTDENQANIFNPATFRDFVLAGYGNACAVTGQLAEGILGMGVDVVYIMPKSAGGSCMPSNGIALVKDLSLAFVRGEFTLSPRFEVMVHPECDNEQIRSYHLKQMRVPSNAFFRPAPESLRYHREKVYGAFIKQ